MSLEELLDQSSVKNLVTLKNLAAIQTDATVEDALQLMEKHHVQSLLVFKGDSFVTMLDNVNLLRYLLREVWSYVDLKEAEFSQADWQGQLTQEQFWSVFSSTNMFLKATIQTVLDVCEQESVLPIQVPMDASDPHPTLKDVAPLFVSGIVPRLPVEDETGKFVGMLSASSYLDVIHHMCNVTQTAIADTIDSVQLLQVPIVQEDIPILSAFYKMYTGGKDCVVIVNESGVATGIITPSDLHDVKGDKVGEIIMQPCSIYCRPRPLYSIKQGASLGECTAILSEKHIHRLLVVDEAGKPKGVATVQGMLLALVPSLQA